MKITTLEQSGLIITADSGKTLAVDIAAFTPLENLNGITVDQMIVSHIHRDHFSPDHIHKLRPKELYMNKECIEALDRAGLDCKIIQISAGETIVAGDFTVVVFPVDHGPNVTAPLPENFGFLITVDGVTIYFAGDMYYPSGINVSDLSVDYAFLPVGGHYTFGPEEAFAHAKQFKRIGKLMSMHYNINPSQHDVFLSLAKGSFDCE